MWEFKTLCICYLHNKIEALHMTYDTVSMADCLHAFKRLTAPTLPFVSLVMKSLLSLCWFCWMDYTTSSLRQGMVQLFCLEAIGKFMQGLYKRYNKGHIINRRSHLIVTYFGDFYQIWHSLISGHLLHMHLIVKHDIN